MPPISGILQYLTCDWLISLSVVSSRSSMLSNTAGFPFLRLNSILLYGYASFSWSIHQFRIYVIYLHLAHVSYLPSLNYKIASGQGPGPVSLSIPQRGQQEGQRHTLFAACQARVWTGYTASLHQTPHMQSFALTSVIKDKIGWDTQYRQSSHLYWTPPTWNPVPFHRLHIRDRAK